ncbi:HWE histidine kinase domain-containing protein [Roseicella frigidaeris]|nr:HWE histidine kinase domain-containing protein [Roseicella frigidaeris]
MHLLGLALVTGLPLLALAIGLAWWIAANARTAALHELVRTAEALQADIDRELQITAAALRVLASAPSLEAALAAPPGSGDPEVFHRRAQLLVRDRPAVLHGIILFDAAGQARVDTLLPPGGPPPGPAPLRLPGPQQLPWNGIAATPPLTVSPLLVEAADGRLVVGVALPVERAGQRIGLLAATLRPESLGLALGSQHLPPGWIATLIDERHTILARSTQQEAYLAQPAIDWVTAFQQGGAAAATVRAVTRAGVPSYAALRRLPVGHWTLALTVPRAAIDGPLRRAVLIAAASGVLAVSLAALLTLALGARLGEEIEALGADAAVVARDQPPPPRPPARVREVAGVRAALAETGAALRARAAAKREAEEHLVLLLREVDHRAKNALAVALSLIRLAPRDVTPAAFATAAEGRITAMARAHALLARGAWTGAELRALAESELPAHMGKVRLSGPPARLSAEAVQPVAMLLHELATNAAKHGALSVPGGEVCIAWEFLPADQALRLTWTERGGPGLDGPPARRSFGIRLVTQLAERQLGARLALDWDPAGLRATLTLPAARAAPDNAALDNAAPAARAAAGLDRSGRPAAVAPRPAWTDPGGPPPRVLVAEDEALLALELETGLRELGCEVVGPARTLAEAQRLAASEPRLAAAVLDINLGGGELIFPVAEALAARGVPYLLATGYGSAGPLEGREAGAVAVLRKPYQRHALAAALASVLPGHAAQARGEGG